MGLRSLLKNYPLFPVFVLLLLGSCQSFHIKSNGPPNRNARVSRVSNAGDAEQKQLEREFKRLEKKAAHQYARSKNKHRSLPDQQIEKVISTARSYRGTPYRYGGTTRIGIDCSGLLCQSYSAIDVQLPRSSTEQSQFGPAVSENDLREGDLVFFSASRGSNTITHVGLVTEVAKPREQVMFIHSSTRLGVIEDNLYAGYWNNLFIKAVRPKL